MKKKSGKKGGEKMYRKTIFVGLGIIFHRNIFGITCEFRSDVPGILSTLPVTRFIIMTSSSSPEVKMRSWCPTEARKETSLMLALTVTS